MAGKGSKPRPMSVSKEKFDSEFERIFGKNKRKEALDELVRISQEAGMYDVEPHADSESDQSDV